MSGILESCKDWKIALLNFTGPNTDPLEYATKSIPQLAKGVSEFKEIFEYKDGKGTIRDYLQNEISLADDKIEKMDKYDIRGDLIYFYDQMLSGPQRDPDPIYKALKEGTTFLDLPMKILGRILVKEKSIGGFDKYAKRTKTNPLKTKEPDDKEGNVQKIEDISIFFWG